MCQIFSKEVDGWHSRTRQVDRLHARLPGECKEIELPFGEREDEGECGLETFHCDPKPSTLQIFGIVFGLGGGQLRSGLFVIRRSLQPAIPFGILPRLFFCRDLSRPVLDGYDSLGHFLAEALKI